jgi:hypothetical protein
MTAVTEETPAPEVQGVEKLRVADRCDCTCNAQAMVAVRIRGTLLLFCGHDFAKHEDALILDGGEVVEDIRASLTARPTNVNAV